MSSGTILINQGRSGMGMLLPQRASSMNNVYRTQKVPFVNMVHVEEKIGLPPVKALRVKYKDLNNNVMVGNVLRPKKDDRPHEKYCSLTVDKQFWRKNINPLLELKREGWDKSGNRFIEKFNNSKYKFCNEIVKNKNKEIIVTKDNNNVVDVVKEDKEEMMKLPSSNNHNVVEKSNEGGNECEMNNNNNDLDKSKDLLEEGEIHNIVNYMSGLDYDKYSKDMELKEALHLLKHKMEKQAAEEIKDNNNIINDNNNNLQKEQQHNEHNDEHETPTTDEAPKHESPPKPIINEEEEKKQEEIDKYKMVEQLSKNKTLRKVHSYKSIQKLLDREGLNDVKLLDTTKFTKANHITFKLPPLCSKDKPTTFNEHS